ncbi:MAG: cation-transporting P-type ATPase, partial [Aquihabitans sp.]
MNAAGTEQGSPSGEVMELVGAAWSLDPTAVLEAMASDADSGLTDAAVRERAVHFGVNEIASGAETPVWKRVLAQFSDPLVLLLLVA